jgi:hypothetical protein
MNITPLFRPAFPLCALRCQDDLPMIFGVNVVWVDLPDCDVGPFASFTSYLAAGRCLSPWLLGWVLAG